MILKMITKYFSAEEKEKRKELRKINTKIAKASSYSELVELVKMYNIVKNEN